MASLNSERETTTDPDDSSEEELVEKLAYTLILFKEQETGELIPEEYHPWSRENKPNPSLKMDDTVAFSSKYPISCDWEGKKTKNRTGSSDQTELKWVDLAKIFSNLPAFVDDEMQGSINASRHELEQLVKKIHQKPDFSPLPEESYLLPPHTREILSEIDPNDASKDRKSLEGSEKFKAASFPDDHTAYLTHVKIIFHFHCEFMLKINVPLCVLKWFDIHQYVRGQCIRKIGHKYKAKRWIFIPSFRRAKIALLVWPQDHIVTEESTIRVLVVRPSEFEEYVYYCGNEFPVICLPQDEIGAGYSRYWIQKIALRLNLQFIWMIDDSVECFYEYHPEQEPTIVSDSTNTRPKPNYKDYRRRKFGVVFERIEDFVKEADENRKPIAAMSPRRWNRRCRPKKPFSCKPPQGAVYLNLRALSKKKVYYRPELKTFEDMIFGYECEQNDLKVYRDNRILLQDHDWKDTGASSPSVKALGARTLSSSKY